MKSFLFWNRCVILFAVLVSFTNYSQDIRWEKSYGGRQADYLFDAQPTADYGFILAGSSLSAKSGNKTEAPRGDLDYWVWKMDENGEPEWQKSFGGSGQDMLKSIKLTNDGGFILAGTSDSPKGLDKKDDSHGSTDFWIIKLDAGGGEQWQKTIGGSGQDDVMLILQTRDGGYIIGGNSASSKSGNKNENSRGNLDYWIVKLDKDGNISWQKTYGGQYADILRSMEQTRDGGYIVGGYSNSPNSGDKTDKKYGIGDYWILKLDDKGSISWQKTYGGDKDDQLYVVHQAYDGNYIIGGNSNSGSSNNKITSNGRGTDFWLLKLNEEGNTLWQETYDFGSADILVSLTENTDHSLLVAGYAKTEGGKDDKGINDYIALKINEKGDKIWQKVVGSNGEDVLRKLIETRDGGYLLAGTSDPESKRYESRRNANGPLKGVDMQTTNNAALAKANKDLDNAVQGEVRDANDYYKKQVNSLTDDANKALGVKEDSRLKLAGNAGDILGANNKGGLPGSGGSADKGPKPGLKPSADKTMNFGGKDFWVVKLKDKEKPEEKPSMVEAIPNPAGDFTNIIVGYEYTKGMCNVYDLGGHQLQRFKIEGRTIPLNLSGLPEGIYIVQIGTDKGTDSVKIIKGITKN